MTKNRILLSTAAVAMLLCTTQCKTPTNDKTILDNLKLHTEYIADDLCTGRLPFSKGADRAVDYIAQQMKQIGLKPINDGSYLQNVELVLSETSASPTMEIKTPKGDISLKKMEGFTAFSKRLEEKIEIDNAKVFFAGYGIVAPLYNKNDYAGIENIEDKIAIVIVNDPGLGSSNRDYFGGDIMTYYGRWKYKYEEAARQNAKGVLIIHETRGAGYPWSVVRASAESKLYLAKRDPQKYDCALEGWISNEAARDLLKKNGYDLDVLLEQSKSPEFKPFDLNTTLSVAMDNKFTYKSSPNVVGYIEGEDQTQESIVYLAHWDHLGYGASIEGDTIINGTSDNATAIAWMLECARKFKESNTKPKRNIVFLSPTCEETGFWGTIYYTENPIFELNKIVAVINLDVFPLWGENNDVTITGWGHTSLDETMVEVAEKYGRYVMPDPEAYNGMFYRSDHFPFVQKGIPAMFAKGWSDNRKHGKEWAGKKIKDYWANTYHKPTDQCTPEDDYRGLLQEVNLLFDFGMKLSQTDGYPQWKESSEFADILKR